MLGVYHIAPQWSGFLALDELCWLGSGRWPKESYPPTKIKQKSIKLMQKGYLLKSVFSSFFFIKQML